MKNARQVAGGETAVQSGWTVMVPGVRRTEFESLIVDEKGQHPGVYLVSALVGAEKLNEEAAHPARLALEQRDSPLLAVRADFRMTADMLVTDNGRWLAGGEQIHRLAATMLAEEPPR